MSAQEMMRNIPGLQGWWMRREASPAAPGYFHPHVHILLHVKPEYSSGRNCMSEAKWTAAWERVLPEELRSTQRTPVLVESVNNPASVVRYIAKSPFLKANGKPNSFESDDHRLIHRIDAAMQLNILITATARMRRYLDYGTLSLSGSSEPEAE
jgi:hypothetical protein